MTPRIIAGHRYPGLSIGTYGVRWSTLPRFKIRCTRANGLLVAAGPVYLGLVW